MRLDIRSTFFSAWLTFLLATFGSTITLNYLRDNREGLAQQPRDLDDALLIWLSLWLGGLLATVWVAWAGWHRGRSSAFWSVLAGYGIGAGLRMIFQGVFLPTSDNFWSLTWGALTNGLPSYPIFVLLVWVGGAGVVLAGTFLSFAIMRGLGVRDEGYLSQLALDTRATLLVMTWMPIILFSMMIIRSLRDDGRGMIRIAHTVWFVLPQTNMILAALIGFLVGGLYLCRDRASAALTLFIALMGHVLIAVCLGSAIGSFDPIRDGLDVNRVPVMLFSFLFIGTPIVGAVAAFALHNLRDAFSLPPILEESPNP